MTSKKGKLTKKVLKQKNEKKNLELRNKLQL